jgi:hypothetical protein
MGYDGGGGGGGGGAGNPGGAGVKLVAANSLINDGDILTKGYASAKGNGGNGANGSGSKGGNGGGGGAASLSGSSTYGTYGNGGDDCGSTRGQRGGVGGAGAGGGVCLICNGPFGIQFESGAVIDTRGGGDNTSNFGSIKSFDVKDASNLEGSFLGGWNGVYGTPYQESNKNWVHVC